LLAEAGVGHRATHRRKEAGAALPVLTNTGVGRGATREEGATGSPCRLAPARPTSASFESRCRRCRICALAAARDGGAAAGEVEEGRDAAGVELGREG
jgi:hypothetical protein